MSTSGCSVHWGNHDTCGDTMSTSGDVQYIEGYQLAPPHVS